MTARLTDAELDLLESELRKSSYYLSDVTADRLKAADAIAALRLERRPREPTTAMLRVNVDNPFNGDQPCSGCLLAEVWRAMYDVAAQRSDDG
jgi:hypothetical protein